MTSCAEFRKAARLSPNRRHNCYVKRLVIVVFLVFFFSSRRRHTRSTRDWSSDVCSSDLVVRPYRYSSGWAVRPTSSSLSTKSTSHRRRTARLPFRDVSTPLASGSANPARSEERRVGKECSTRRSRDDEKENRKSDVRMRH